MAILCNNGCLNPAQLPSNYEDYCDPVRRKAGWPHLIFIPCGANFDPSSAANWASNGVITPKGKVTLSSPTVNETDEFSTCGEKEVMDTVYTLDYQSFAGFTDGSDMTFWKTLTKNYKQFYVAAISCDERVLVAGDYTDATTSTDYSPGYQFNITEPPHEMKVQLTPLGGECSLRSLGRASNVGMGICAWDSFSSKRRRTKHLMNERNKIG